MPALENLVRTIAAGEVIKPWIMLGTFNIDISDRVTGLTYFEQSIGSTQVGISVMDEVVPEALSILSTQPREGEKTEFLGNSGFWNLVRGPEEYLSWGTYNIKNHLGAAFLSNVLVPAESGVKQWVLKTRGYQRVLVTVNGQLVYDSANSRGDVVNGVSHYTFSAELISGPNHFNIGLFRLGRMAQVGFRLECDGEVEASTQLPNGISLETREKVEQELSSIRFDRDIFYPDHWVGFLLGYAGASSTPGLPHLEVELLDKYHQQVAVTNASGVGRIELCQGKDLEDKPYTIVCTWRTPLGHPVTASSYLVRKITPVEPPLGYEKIGERSQLLLNHFSDYIESDAHSIWREVALYASGQYDRINIETLRRTCEFIAARNDCSDFVIQAILRLMFWERTQQRLSPEINALMKDTVLGFKYWVDEPGDTVMYMGSENHRLLFHVAEWMAGMLFPTEEFTNSRQNGLFHYQKAYVYITEWLRQRGR